MLTINARYQVVAALGQGSQATVLRVLDLHQEGLPLALKLHLNDGASDLARWEFAQLRRLSHPNLARVYDLGTVISVEHGHEHEHEHEHEHRVVVPEGALFLTQELVPGRSAEAAAEARRGDLAALEQWVAAVGAAVAKALATLHLRGMVHRDVKPGNVVVGDEPSAAKLVDLALSAAGGAGTAAGSVGYMAPEALAGAAEPRSDLFALGATLYQMLAGRLPFGDPGSLEATVRAILDGHVTPLAQAVPGISPGMSALVGSLLAPDPGDRPGSARAVLLELGRLYGPETVGLPAGPTGEVDAAALLADLPGPPAALAREGAVLGRRDEVEQLIASLRARLERTGSGSPVLALVGPAGAGKSAVLREALQRLQLRAIASEEPAPVRISGAVEVIARALRSGAEHAALAGGTPRLDAWLGLTGRDAAAPEGCALCEELTALARAAASIHPLVLHLEDGAAGLGRELLLYLHRRGEIEGITAASDRVPLALVAELRAEPGELAPAPDGVESVEIGPLGDREIGLILAERLGREPPAPLLHAARAAARGRPLLLGAFLSRVLSRWSPAELDELDEQALAGVEIGGDAAEALAGAVDALAPELREPLLALALVGRPTAARELAELLGLDTDQTGDALGQLWRLGWIELDREGRATTRGADLASLARREDQGWVTGIHRRAAELLARIAPEERGARARHAVAGGLGMEAGELSLEAGQYLLSAGDAAGACSHLEAAVELCPPSRLRKARSLWRRALVVAGRYTEATEQLRPLAQRGEPGARLELARVLRLGGDREGARREAERALTLPDQENGARAVLARLALDQGRARAAIEAAGDLRPGEARGEDAAALEEAVGLARLALGDPGRAREHFRACLDLARSTDDEGARATRARAHNLLGMEAHHREDWEEAVERYRRAEELARTAGLVHAAATYGVNLAVARLERGDLGQALGPLGRAIASLAGVGRTGELANALHNDASLLLALGDLEGCERVLERALSAAREVEARQVEAYGTLLRGDLLRRQGSASEAEAAYRTAIERFRELEAPREEALSRLALAEVLVEAAKGTPAVTQLGEAAELSERVGSPELRLRAALTRARLALAGALDPDRARHELREALSAMDREPQLDLRWRADLLAARLEGARGDRLEAARLAEAAAELAWQAEAKVPDAFRERWASDPDRLELRRLGATLFGASAPAVEPGLMRPAGEGGSDPAALRKLLDINKRLNSELRLGRLLDEIIDTIIELTRAERGFLLIRRRDGQLRPRSARNLDRRSLESEELSLSRSIAEQVVETGRPVLTVDAQSDQRFGAVASVHTLRLRSILAVPLRVKGEVVGAVYVDDRVRPGAFGQGAMQLAQDVADQAAIAVENARLHAENRRRQRQIESLNRQLQSEVDRQRVELEELQRELDDQRRGLATKYSYEAIVARSAAMEKVFRILDRVIDSEVPVVIQGESGTGKELVARAIHFNGPRQDRPFVTENCGAIPETLLESVLFGHVRGAFTGADRSRQGLFEIASGGTLLLDEVSEMSPAMQAKLLRVLQEGEVRPVGGERLIRVDVRVIASSNRDLGELVRRNEFRQDLFYRLNVITVRLPPLRERPEDIPLLVEHFLSKHGEGRVTAVDRNALRRFTSYQWPGNVRQLENEVMRASVLADETIREEHLSPDLLDEAGPPLPEGSELDIRAHVERLERSLIRRALDRFAGNQSRSAEALGLSRYGLQKKMTRYGMRKAKSG